jgi:hypothetical protein
MPVLSGRTTWVGGGDAISVQAFKFVVGNVLHANVVFGVAEKSQIFFKGGC